MFKLGELLSTQGAAPGIAHSRRAKAPGTCGELVQGSLEGADFLINFPISLYSDVTARQIHAPGVVVRNPGDFTKLRRTAEAVLVLLEEAHRGIELEVHSSIPRGKGLASSTSEMAAAAEAVQLVVGKRLPAEILNRVLAQIDPSDGVVFPGIARCNSMTGAAYELYGAPPLLRTLIIDTGGEVETAQYDRKAARRHAEAHQPELREAVNLVRLGLKHGKPTLIARGATLSSTIHQEFLPKPGFEKLLRKIRPQDAPLLGLACGHTGTVLGALFDPRKTTVQELVTSLGTEIPGNILGVFDLVSGGAHAS